MTDRTDTISTTLDLLSDELGVKLPDAKRKALADYLDRHIVPEGTQRKRTVVPKETVETIRAEYAAMQAEGKTSMTQLANRYGVSVSTVQRYVAGTLRA